MKGMAEMSHTYFPKVVPDFVNTAFDISKIILPPCRLQQLRSFLVKPNAQFTCPEQAVLLELMMQRSLSVLAILGTGFGNRERDGLPWGFPEQPAPVPVKTRTRSHGPGF